MTDKNVTSVKLSSGADVKIGMEATYSIGSDSYPGKVSRIERVRGGHLVTIQLYNYKAKEGSKDGYGSQDWEILWDKPTHEQSLKLNLKGLPLKNTSGKFLFGKAHVHYDWSF